MITDCIPIKGLIDGSLLGLGFINLAGLIIAWFLCFAVFRQHVIVKIPLNEEMIKFFIMSRIIKDNFKKRFGNPARIEIRYAKDKMSPSEDSYRSEQLSKAYAGVLKGILGREKETTGSRP